MYERDLKKLGFRFKETEPAKLIAEEAELQVTLDVLRSSCIDFADRTAAELSAWPEETATFGRSVLSPIRIYGSKLPYFIAERLPEDVAQAYVKNQEVSGTHIVKLLPNICVDQFSDPDTVSHELTHNIWDRLKKNERDRLLDLFQKEQMFRRVFQLLYFSSDYQLHDTTLELLDALRAVASITSGFGAYSSVEDFLRMDMEFLDSPLISFESVRSVFEKAAAMLQCTKTAIPLLGYKSLQLKEVLDKHLHDISTELFAYGLSGLKWGASKYYSREFLDYLINLELDGVKPFAYFLEHHQKSVPAVKTRHFNFLCGLRSEIVDQELDN
jgi:hypothetical protein